MISNMILESPTMLERTVKSYKQETKELKWNYKPQFTTVKRIIFWKVTWVYFKSIFLIVIKRVYKIKLWEHLKRYS